MDYSQRRLELQRKLRRKKIDALLVSRPENRRYLSGFSATDHSISESSGLLFIPARGKSLLLTDFRYQLQARNETELEVYVYKKGLVAALKDILGSYDVTSFGFESHHTLYSLWTKLASLSDRMKISLVPVSGLIEQLRVIKSEAELELIRRSVRLNEQVFENIFSEISAQMSEIEVALAIESSMRLLGAEAAAFETIVLSGENSALVHGIPSRMPIKRNGPTTIDMGAIVSGYCSDMTRTFVLGKADDTYLKLHRLVRRAQKAGMAAVRAGAVAADVDRAARKIISDAGYGKCFGHSLGHGVGLEVHEDPRVSGKSGRKLKKGMVITIEPGIYIPGWGGIRLENMVAVRENDGENLNTNTTWLDI